MSEKPTNPKDAIGIRKAPMSVVPSGVLAEVGVGMLEGAAKYGRHNYRGTGVRSSVYYDATFRHLLDYWEGEDIDPDSGLSHLTKAICSLVVWRDALMQDKCEDDRPPRSVPFYPKLNAKVGEILDRHAGKSPKHWTVADCVRPPIQQRSAATTGLVMSVVGRLRRGYNRRGKKSDETEWRRS